MLNLWENRTKQLPQHLYLVPAKVNAHMSEAGMVLLHTGTGLVFAVNRMGARIWQGISRLETVEFAAAQISEEFGVPAGLALEESQAFVSALSAQGLLERRGKN